MRLIAAFCLLPFAATAQDVDCTNAVTQQEMNLCAELDWQVADAELNDAYAAVIAMMQNIDAETTPIGVTEEARLREAQRAWVAFRDATCDVAGYAMRGGSAEPLLIYGCMMTLSAERADELRGLVEDY
jgi:uncharacterized protein YecT (DUF1311 family)